MWYATGEEELVFEIHGNLKGILILKGEDGHERKFNVWQEVLHIYSYLIEGRRESAKRKFGIFS
jgi:hypothetical protein